MKRFKIISYFLKFKKNHKNRINLLFSKDSSGKILPEVKILPIERYFSKYVI